MPPDTAGSAGQDRIPTTAASEAAQVGALIGDALEAWGYAVPDEEKLGQAAIEAVESVIGKGDDAR